MSLGKGYGETQKLSPAARAVPSSARSFAVALLDGVRNPFDFGAWGRGISDSPANSRAAWCHLNTARGSLSFSGSFMSIVLPIQKRLALAKGQIGTVERRAERLCCPE